MVEEPASLLASCDAGFLQKLNWEDETANVPTTVWDSFFEIMEKMLQSENMKDLMVETHCLAVPDEAAAIEGCVAESETARASPI